MKPLTQKQWKAIHLLLEGMTYKAAAEKVGVSPQTMTGWTCDPLFIASLNTAREDILNEHKIRLSTLTNKALIKLEQLSESAKSEELQFKAAVDLLKISGFYPGTERNPKWSIGPTKPNDVYKVNPLDPGGGIDPLIAELFANLKD